MILMDRPDVGNALDDQLIAALQEAFAEAISDPQVRAIVLAGADPAFCVGADVRQLAASLDFAEGPAEYWRPRLEVLASLILTIASAPMPTICALNGQAAGSGFALALACDLRVASERAVFNFAYGSLGSSTDAGLAWLLVRAVGRTTALQMLLEQPIIRASRACELGLVSDLLPIDMLITGAQRIAASAGSGAQHAIRTAKRLVGMANELPLDEHIKVEHQEFLAEFSTEDMRAGLRARLSGNVESSESD